MKRNRLPMLLRWVHWCAVFSLFGFWQEKRELLPAVVAVVAVFLVLFFWMARRRRQGSSVDARAEAPCEPEPQVADLIEGLSGSGQPVSGGSSPGLHGKIEVRIGDQTIGSYLVTDNPLTIGRDPAQALVVIEEPIISKLHCQVFARAGLVFVKDLHSTNGVYVNEEKIGERELRDGDEVFLGRKGTVRIAYHRQGAA